MKTDISRLTVALVLIWTTGTATAGCWTPVADQSSLTFQVRQADAPLQGSFGDYDALVCIDPKDPGANSVRVSVDLTTVNSGISELDEALRGGDFFAVDRWPTATFESDSVTAEGPDSYTASGTLSIRGQSKPLEVPFEFHVTGNCATASGSTTIKRLDYGIGQGEWSDTKWVGDDVEIDFDVTLAPQAAAEPSG